jgi:predicted metalloprotease with PDZ domain
MTKEDRLKQRQLMRVAIPAAVCVVTIVAIALGTRVWQRTAAGPSQAMELRGQWLGMRLAATNVQAAADLGVPPEVKGVVVAEVQGGSRALLAGLAAGDVVTRVNGKAVNDLLEMYTLSSRLDNTRALQLEFLRAGRPMVASMLPPESVMPPGAAWSAPRQAAAAEGGGWAGVSANEATATPMRRDSVRTQ